MVYLIDFENEETDTPIGDIGSLSDLWIAGNATGDYISKIEERKGSKVLHFAPFSRMYTAEGISNKYAFSADLNLPGDQGFGMFFRSSGEESVNPYFEDDGSGLGIFGIGPAGIYIIPNGKQLKIMVKYYDERKNSDKGGKYISNKQITLKADCDFGENFNNITVLDDGTGAKIYVNGALFASMKFGEIVEGYEELLSFCSYFSVVTVYDADGKEKATVKNALVCADDSTLAFGMRINEAYIDNVSVTEYPYTISKTELKAEPKTNYYTGDRFDGTGSELDITLENGVVRKVQLTESMLEGFDTGSAGTHSVTVKWQKLETSFDITVNSKIRPLHWFLIGLGLLLIVGGVTAVMMARKKKVAA